MNFLKMVPKPVIFAVSAAVGCMFGDIATEILGMNDNVSQGLMQAFFNTAAWSVFLCFGMSIGIVTMQNRLMHKPALALPQLFKVALGAIIGGALAGAVGQGLYSLSYNFLSAEHPSLHNVLSRAIAWGLIGCIVSRAMTRFIANLNKTWALLGGFAGGVVGCIGFLQLSNMFNDMAGRLLGVFLLGLCVGAMVGVVEVVVREAYLNVIYSPKEQTKINLGAAQVSFGTGKADTVFVNGSSPSALTFKMENGAILCTENGSQRAVASGDRIPVGKLTVEVCFQQTAKTAGAKNTRPAPQKTASVKNAPPVLPAASGTSVFYLYVKNKEIPLVKGQKLYACNTVAGSEDRSTVSGEVISKKTDPTKLAIRNLSDQTWVFAVPGADRRIAYKKGQVFEINNDVQGDTIVDFQGITGKIAKG